jgi:hypothetical protein
VCAPSQTRVTKAELATRWATQYGPQYAPKSRLLTGETLASLSKSHERLIIGKIDYFGFVLLIIQALVVILISLSYGLSTPE